MAFRGPRSADDRFDLEVERVADGVEMRVTSHATAEYQVALRWDAPAGTTPTVESDGVAVPAADITRVTHFGQQSLTLPVTVVAASATLRVVVR